MFVPEGEKLRVRKYGSETGSGLHEVWLPQGMGLEAPPSRPKPTSDLHGE